MPTTTRQALRYPQATDASAALWTYWENLAKDVDAKATFRGTGTALPATNLAVGDRYYHTTYRCFLVYNGSGWRQLTTSQVTSDSDRTSFVAAVAGAGLTMHNGFQVFQTDTNQLWVSIGGTTIISASPYRGDGATFPTNPQRGDFFYHSVYQAEFIRTGNDIWRQVSDAIVADTAARTALTTAIGNAGLGLFNGYRVFQSDTNTEWIGTGSALAPIFSGDTGALELTMSGTWVKVVGRLQMRSGWVNVTIQATRASWTAGTALTTIGTAYRPGNNQWITGSYQGNRYEVGFSTAGAVTVNDAGTGGIVVSATWPA